MILFGDSRCFQKDVGFDLEEIKDKYLIELEDMKIVRVKTKQGKELQVGLMIDVRNRELFKKKVKEIVDIYGK